MGRSTGEGSHPVAYTLRPATADDFAFIYRLRVSGLREHVARIWGWDEGEQRARFAGQFSPGAYQVIVVDGQDVGAVSVAWGSDEVFLSDLEVAPPWRRRGVGTAVLGDILAEARRRQRVVRLQVLKGNPARRRLLNRGSFDRQARHIGQHLAQIVGA